MVRKPFLEMFKGLQCLSCKNKELPFFHSALGCSRTREQWERKTVLKTKIKTDLTSSSSGISGISDVTLTENEPQPVVKVEVRDKASQTTLSGFSWGHKIELVFKPVQAKKKKPQLKIGTSSGSSLRNEL